MLTIKTEGRRTYIVGNTFQFRDRLRALGAHWDASRKAWWTGKREEAEALVAEINASGTQREKAQDKAPRYGLDSIIAGRVEYKGRAYYAAGKETHRSYYDSAVAPVTTKDGSRILLYFRDGSRQFWADASEIRWMKRYSIPQTIRSVRAYAQEARSYGTGECRCSCHREPNAGAPGTTLYDGCDRCGCEAV